MVARIGPKRLRSKAIPLFLREWREARSLTQEQLADRLDTTKATISRYETGSRDWTGQFVQAAAEALGIEVADMFRHPGSPSIDAMIRQAPPVVQRQAQAAVEAIVKTGTGR